MLISIIYPKEKKKEGKRRKEEFDNSLIILSFNILFSFFTASK